MPSGKSRRLKSAAAPLDRAKTNGQAAITTHMVSQTEMAVDLATAMQTIATGQAALMDKIDHLQTNVDFCQDLDSLLWLSGRGGAAGVGNGYGTRAHRRPAHTEGQSESPGKLCRGH